MSIACNAANVQKPFGAPEATRRTTVNGEVEDAFGSHVAFAHWSGRVKRARRRQLRLIFEVEPIDAWIEGVGSIGGCGRCSTYI